MHGYEYGMRMVDGTDLNNDLGVQRFSRLLTSMKY